MLPELLHGEERKGWGDGGYQGQTELERGLVGVGVGWGDGGYQGQTESIREAAPPAQGMTFKRTKFKHGVQESPIIRENGLDLRLETGP